MVSPQYVLVTWTLPATPICRLVLAEMQTKRYTNIARKRNIKVYRGITMIVVSRTILANIPA